MSQPAESLKVYVPEKNPKVYMPEKSPKSERGTHKSQGNVGKTQGFESPELVRLFGIIDKLRECGVSEDISLPQLVVVGDQSSGKSSVLEALTGIPFPVASTLCTRYPTQINFRRSAYERVTVTITPASDSDSDRAAVLRKFSHHLEALTEESFSDLLNRASEAMGLPKPGEDLDDSAGARFSDDVLKIELSGPEKPHFSVVDVPGLFQSATAHQSKTDLIIVENMAKRYLADPRTIIIAVGSSVNETANQKVFQLAREADATGTRTVGVLTKPDAIQEGDEGRVMDVARNKVTILYHGWLVVRNRSTDDINKGVTLEGRLKNEEAFFKTEPWRNLDKERVGIKSLEYFTRNLLYSHIRKEYPILVEELEKKVQDLRQAINKLGPARETPDQQRSVLIEISNNFQTLARDARMGLYHSSLDDVELRLRNSIRNLNDAFAKSVKEKGHLHDFFGEDTKMIHEWILKIHLRSRGVEMDGMVNPEVFKTLFRLQTESWGGIAGEHIMCVNNLVNEFIRRVLTDKCPDSELRSKLGGFLAPRFTATLDGAKEELQKILKVERGEVLLTYDDGFVKTLDDIRKQRMLGDITGSVLLKFDSEDTLNTSAKINNIFQESYKTREQQAVHEMHDYLKSYYTAARTRFIDCVCMQVVERHFLGEHGSVQAFSPATIGRLSTEELQGIAGEDFSIVSTRRTLKEKLARLEVAQTIANAGYV